MTPRLAARLAWGSLAVYVLVATAGTVLMAQTPIELVPASDEPAPLAGQILFALAILIFAFVGALVAARRPRHPIGWLLCATAVLNGLSFLGIGYARYALLAEPGSLPGPEILAWASELAIDLQWGLFLVMLLLFPDGRLPSPRWRIVLWIAIAVNAAEVLDSALEPGALEGFASAQNPFGVEGAQFLRAIEPDVAGTVALLPAVGSLFVRRRHATAEERQQLKAFLFALVTVAVALLLLAVTISLVELSEATIQVLNFAIVSLFASLAIALGVAVLKYRLYDVDLVINRTLVYGTLTATLAAAYLGGVLLLQLALSPLTTESDLAIAGSTLAVAALFRPARRHIQGLVDRRFYRSRYDAQRTLESFGTRLRDEVELDSLSADLRAVVADAMQPAHVSLWLRAPSSRERASTA